MNVVISAFFTYSPGRLIFTPFYLDSLSSFSTSIFYNADQRAECLSVSNKVYIDAEYRVEELCPGFCTLIALFTKPRPMPAF